MQYRSYIYSGHINSKKLEYNPVSIRALSWKYGNKISCRCDGAGVSKRAQRKGVGGGATGCRVHAGVARWYGHGKYVRGSY